MQIKRLVVLISILILTIAFNNYIYSQALPIGIDGKFEDWDNASEYTDNQNDGANIDFLSFKVSNDSNYLFIQFTLSQDIELDDNNNIYLEIDADNNPATGYSVNGIGADLAVKFDSQDFIYTHSGGTDYLIHSDIGFYALPTVSSDTFELAISRSAEPDGINLLFSNPSIKICFKENDSGGDYIPNYGSTFTYTFDETPVESYPIIDFEKNNPTDLRLMTFNTLSDGLIDAGRVESFERIIKSVNPDIITFNECWNTTQYEAKNRLNSWIPISGNGWYAVKSDNGNITCSKFPITQYFTIDPTYINRITANLIELPETFLRDILIINAHLKASGGAANDAIRQEQADAIINFIRDVKTPGGALTLPYGTPIVISGDLNLVGSNQILKTLLTGDIVNNSAYGSDISPDWNQTDFTDALAYQTNERTAYTWLDESSDYWAGRLDYTIYSDRGTSVSKTFIVNTRKMSSEQLSDNNLLISDSYIASDHMPKITDFIIEDVIAETNTISYQNFIIYPNPVSSENLNIEEIKGKEIKEITIYNNTGQLIFNVIPINSNKITIHTGQFSKGIYFLKIRTAENEILSKFIKGASKN